MMKITYAGTTDIGQVRTHNEDSFAIIPERNLIVVCDGMGGHAAGEVASRLAVETITEIFRKPEAGIFDDPRFEFPSKITSEGKLLVGAISVANLRVLDRSKKSSRLAGMGTTVISCHFNDGIASLCHVGDSRGYLIRDSAIKRITVDHSWVHELMEIHKITEEESKNFVNSNVITRALGTRQVIKTDISEIGVRKDDLFLFCSDGLTAMVDDGEILKIAKSEGHDLDGLVEKLIQMANDAGGVDNITLCIARVESEETTRDIEEIRRLTVEWGEGRELEAIKEIIEKQFPPAVDERSEYDEDTGPIAVPQKKKSKRGLLVAILFLIIVAAAVLYIILR